MPATRAYYGVTGAVGKDPAVSQISVTIDPKKWSKRKRNIVVTSLRTGVAACGYATGALVDELTRAASAAVMRVHKWDNNMQVEFIKPEKLEDLIAYTCAWIKLKRANMENEGRRYSGLDWSEQAFINRIEHNVDVGVIPLPNNLSETEKREFIAEYMREPSEQEVAAREALARMVEDGQPITVTMQ